MSGSGIARELLEGEEIGTYFAPHLFASFLTALGLFRLIAAISLHFHHWGYAVFDGIVTFGLGILLWADWPCSGLWFVGFSVAIFVVLRGLWYVMLSLPFTICKCPSKYIGVHN